MNKTILIVDDDDALRNSVARGLRAENFYVLGAANAANATEILSRIQVDLIILDRMMTGTDGLAFLQSLRATGNTTPTIMLTAMGGADNRIDGLAGGADDYMDKPFQMRELILRIEKLIQRTPSQTQKMPSNLILVDDEFFAKMPGGEAVALNLSAEEKKLLYNLTMPVGNISAAPPMVAKRLREKLNGVILDTDIVTIRGRGYKLVYLKPDKTTNGARK
jgi:DNA-binding response OmpR family regulator